MTNTSCIKRVFCYSVDWSIPGGGAPNLGSIAALSLTGRVYTVGGTSEYDTTGTYLNINREITEVFIDPANDQAVLNILAQTPNVLTWSESVTIAL